MNPDEIYMTTFSPTNLTTNLIAISPVDHVIYFRTSVLWRGLHVTQLETDNKKEKNTSRDSVNVSASSTSNQIQINVTDWNFPFHLPE